MATTRNANQSSAPVGSASSVNPDTTRTARVKINGEVKEFTCTVVKSGRYSNKLYHLIEDYVENGVTKQKKSIINGYHVSYDSVNKLSFIEDASTKKKTYFDDSGNEVDPPSKDPSKDPSMQDNQAVTKLEKKFNKAKEALEAAQKACDAAELAYRRKMDEIANGSR